MRKTRSFVAAGASLLLVIGVMLTSGTAASAEEPSPAATTESNVADPSSTAAPVQQLDCDAITVNYQRPLQNGDHINLQFDPGARQVNAYVDRNLGGHGDLGIRFSTGQTRPLTQQEVESGTILWAYPAAIGSTTFTVTFVQTNQTDTWRNLPCTPDAPPVPHCDEGQVLAADGATCETPPVVEEPKIDLGLVKTHSDLAEASVEAGDTFSYFLTVTNHGTAATTTAVVTDAVPAGLTVHDVIVPGPWANESSGNDLKVSGVSLTPGASGVIEVKVQVDGADYTAPLVVQNDPDPAPSTTISGPFINTACVTVPDDIDHTNDCSSVTIDRDEISANVFVRCINDAPYLSYSVRTSESLAGKPITLTWAPGSGAAQPAEVVRQLQSGDSGVLPWPGVTIAANGNSIGWPGYRPVTSTDYHLDGTLAIDPADVYNGQVLDESSPTYPWRLGSTVTFAVNPTLTVTATYPEATPNCAAPRTTDVSIVKTASVDTVASGASFDYVLAVSNLSTDSVAEPVVVTDVIPADIRVDDVVTDAAVFPRWQDCTHTGADAQGFGGTVECSLRGPLGLGAAAPIITLEVTARAGVAAGSITNSAEVCAGGADSVGELLACANDDATVKVVPVPVPVVASTPAHRAALLAVTGNAAAPWLGVSAAAAMMGGAVLLCIATRRRRRSE